MLTQTLIRELFEYSYEGQLLWKVKVSAKVVVGSVAGKVDESRGYTQIILFGKTHYLHKLVYVYHHGELPTTCVDHIDGDRRNNRIENLRAATHQQNSQNSKPRVGGSSQFKGVGRSRGKWRARIFVEGREVGLGRFDCEYCAAAAYDDGAKKHFGEFAVLNFGGE